MINVSPTRMLEYKFPSISILPLTSDLCHGNVTNHDYSHDHCRLGILVMLNIQFGLFVAIIPILAWANFSLLITVTFNLLPFDLSRRGFTDHDYDHSHTLLGILVMQDIQPFFSSDHAYFCRLGDSNFLPPIPENKWNLLIWPLIFDHSHRDVSDHD